MSTPTYSPQRARRSDRSPLARADQYAALRTSLVAALSEHTAQHEEILASIEASQTETDHAELATTMLLAALLREAIDEIEAALTRLDRGSYGDCESCGSAIPAARLEAIPHVRVCVSCPPPRRSHP